MYDRELHETEGWNVVVQAPKHSGVLVARDLARGLANGAAATLERNNHAYEYGYVLLPLPDQGYDVRYFRRRPVFFE